MARLNVRQIEAFNAVMKGGSVTKAAKTLFITQPAVTKLIQAFEYSCGFDLFNRATGRLIPTPEARQLFVETQRLESWRSASIGFEKPPMRYAISRGAKSPSLPSPLSVFSSFRALSPVFSTQPPGADFTSHAHLAEYRRLRHYPDRGFWIVVDEIRKSHPEV